MARAYDARGLTAFTLAMRRNWTDTEAQVKAARMRKRILFRSRRCTSSKASNALRFSAPPSLCVQVTNKG
jgi:hypothetical protein